MDLSSHNRIIFQLLQTRKITQSHSFLELWKTMVLNFKCSITLCVPVNINTCIHLFFCTWLHMQSFCTLLLPKGYGTAYVWWDCKECSSCICATDKPAFTGKPRICILLMLHTTRDAHTFLSYVHTGMQVHRHSTCGAYHHITYRRKEKKLDHSHCSHQVQSILLRDEHLNK